jgi:putative sporulation protein YyaC
MSTFSFLTRFAPADIKSTIADEIKIPAKVKYHYQDPHVVERLSFVFSHYINKLNPDLSRPLIIVAIGTDRSTGDCLGPLIGTKLVNSQTGLHVFGTLEDPVHASNLNNKLDEIKKNFKNPLIVAIDASLGQVESVGSITLATGALRPGAGVNKKLQEVGEIHFTGIVNVGGYMEYFVLQNTRLGLVWKLADIIAKSIKTGFKLAQTNLFNNLHQILQ